MPDTRISETAERCGDVHDRGDIRENDEDARNGPKCYYEQNSCLKKIVRS